jgi:hypothetical protein
MFQPTPKWIFTLYVKLEIFGIDLISANLAETCTHGSYPLLKLVDAVVINMRVVNL